MPTPRNVREWMELGLSREAAEHKMRQDVFGHDYKLGTDGQPLETGIGSPAQLTKQHYEQLAREKDRIEMMRKPTDTDI